MTHDSWDEWGKHVLAEIKRLSDVMHSHVEQEQKWQMKIAEDISALKVKAGFWGAFGGALTALVAWLTTHK